MAKSNPRVIIERMIIERIVINVLIIKISSYRMTLLLKSYKTIFIEYPKSIAGVQGAAAP